MIGFQQRDCVLGLGLGYTLTPSEFAYETNG
jgi:hypothetical protein